MSARAGGAGDGDAMAAVEDVEAAGALDEVDRRELGPLVVRPRDVPPARGDARRRGAEARVEVLRGVDRADDRERTRLRITAFPTALAGLERRELMRERFMVALAP